MTSLLKIEKRDKAVANVIKESGRFVFWNHLPYSRICCLLMLNLSNLDEGQDFTLSGSGSFHLVVM